MAIGIDTAHSLGGKRYASKNSWSDRPVSRPAVIDVVASSFNPDHPMFAPCPPNPLDATQLDAILRERLSQQRFDDSHPGPILRDFQTLLDCLGSSGVPITERSQLPTLKFLHKFNETLSRPTRLHLKRANQKHYAYAIGMFWLIRSLGLALPDVKRKNRLIAPPDPLNTWKNLSAEEQYFTLLAAWLHHAKPEVLDGNRGPYAIHSCLDLFEKLQAKGKPLQVIGCDPRNQKQSLVYFPGLHNLALMDGFGFVDLELVEPAVGQAWSMRSIALTEWGEAMLTALELMYPPDSRWQLQALPNPFEKFEDPADDPLVSASVPFAPESTEYQLLEQIQGVVEAQLELAEAEDKEVDEAEFFASLKATIGDSPERLEAMQSLMMKAIEENEAEFAAVRHRLTTGENTEQITGLDLYYDSFRAFVPQLSQTLAREVMAFNPNLFIFKVSVAQAWRRLAVPGIWPLDGLAGVILEAFEFEDTNHLFAFNFWNTSGVEVSVVNEYTEFGVAKAHEVRVGDLPIAPGTHIDFNFDFGDNWHFDLLLESIEPIYEAMIQAPNVEQIGSQGQAPKQYPDSDDW